MDKRDNMEKRYTDENGIRFVDIKMVGDYYGVSKETVLNWIKDGKISGKQLLGHRGKWFIPAEEFEYLKHKQETDEMEEHWEVELDDE